MLALNESKSTNSEVEIFGYTAPYCMAGMPFAYLFINTGGSVD
jgi:hypothetical protein